MLPKSPNRNFARLTLSVFLAIFSVLPALATEYITYVKVIGSMTKHQIEDLKDNYQDQGWKVVDKDLNAGASGFYIYLLYSTRPSTLNGTYEYITDFYISNEENAPNNVYHNGRHYQLASCDGTATFINSKGDLNHGCGGDYIHLYYTTDAFPDNRAVTSISFNASQSGAVGVNGGSTGYDLNKGAGGEYIYMHFTTNPPPIIQGYGTANEPYVIHNLESWNQFAANVNNGNSYSGKYFKLVNNVSGVTTMVGDADHPFSGVFNGEYHTLTVNMTGPEASSGNSASAQIAAPFRKISNSTISGLIVRGTVNGRGYHAAGLVGTCTGNSAIYGCGVYTDVTGVGYVGGIVGHGGKDRLTMNRCYFAGTISGFNVFAAGLVGWCDDLEFTITQSLFKGTFSPSSGGKYHPIILSNDGSTASGTVTETYYLYENSTTVPSNSNKLIAGADGMAVNAEEVEGRWNYPVTACDGQTYYGGSEVVGLISKAPDGVTKYYTRSGSVFKLNNDHQAELGQQEGYISIVYGYDGYVYMYNPISGFPTNMYIRGTKEGNLLTFPLPQSIYYNPGNNLDLAWVNIPSGTSSPMDTSVGTVDRSTTTATFTIDGNTLRLNGSSQTHVLGAVWSSYDVWYGTGIYGSVYTETNLNPISPPANLSPVIYYYNGTTHSDKDYPLSSTVRVVKDGNDVYIQGLAAGDNDNVILPYAWVKGTLSGNILTIPRSQFVGYYNNKPIYLVGTLDNALQDVKFIYNPHLDLFTLSNVLYVSNRSDMANYYTMTKIGATISADKDPDQLVNVPDGVEIEDGWKIVGNFYTSEEENISVSRSAQVAFDGNDVYIKGIPYYAPDAWLKGTINGNVATFPTGQYVGTTSNGKEYMVGLDLDSNVTDIEFTYNSYAKTFILSTMAILETPTRNKYNYYGFYIGLTIQSDDSPLNNPITEAPEGEVKLYTRSGGAYTLLDNSQCDKTSQDDLLAIVYGNDGFVYLPNLVSNLYENLYVRGWIEGNTLTVPLYQKLSVYDQNHSLMLAWVDIPDRTTAPFSPSVGTMDNSKSVATFTIDGNTISLNGSSENHVLGAVWDYNNAWTGVADYETVFTLSATLEPITPPSGIRPATYSYEGTTYHRGVTNNFATTVQVVKDGNDYYIKGLATADDDFVVLPDAWAKGTLEGNTLTIPDGQYMGLYNGGPIFLSSAYYAIVFNYDALDKAFTLQHEMYLNARNYDIYYYAYTKPGAVIKAIIPTAIDGNTDDDVKSVRYYNAAGVQTENLSEGVNIIMKEKKDGTTIIKKVVNSRRRGK